MGFASGSISFRRFIVVGDGPSAIDQKMLDKLAEHALRPGDMGVPDEVEYGWSGGRHVLDGVFSFENNVFAEALHFALRIDTNKVPGELGKAYKIMEEEAVARTNPSGFISKDQKKDVRETLRGKLDEELRSGKFRRSKLVSILWDVPAGVLYCNASTTEAEKLMEIFERTFRLDLLPISAGSLALRILQPKSRRRDYEDLKATRFVSGPEGERQAPEYPWVAKGAEPKDFIGNEFVTWLWHEAESRTSSVVTDQGEVTLFFDRSLDLDCAYGQTGRDTLRGDGVTRMPEAIDALRSGKVPRKAGLLLDANNLQYTLTLQAERLSFGALKLPEVEDADNPRVVFEERVALLRDFCKMFDALFGIFLKARAGGSWDSEAGAMRKWIQRAGRSAPVAAVA